MRVIYQEEMYPEFDLDKKTEAGKIKPGNGYAGIGVGLGEEG